jgi:hypothetical protein
VLNHLSRHDEVETIPTEPDGQRGVSKVSRNEGDGGAETVCVPLYSNHVPAQLL